MDHRHPAPPGERDRQAVGDDDQRREPRALGDLTVDLGEPGAGLGEGDSGTAVLSWRTSSAPCTWRPISTRSGSTPSATASR